MLKVAKTQRQRPAKITTFRVPFLPETLVEARSKAYSKEYCQDLSRTAREVLHACIPFLRAYDLKHPIYPSRVTLLEQTAITHVRTLQNGLKQLEDRGYITREQTMDKHGFFSVSEITFTEKALVNLGLRKERTPKSTKEDNSGNNKEKEEVKLLTNKESSESIAFTTVEHTKDTYFIKTPISVDNSVRNVLKDDNQIDRSTKLPVALLPLIQLGLSPKAVSALMRTAKEFGKRLEDVMKVTYKYLKKLNRYAIYAYLVVCLRKEQDFKTTVEEKQKDSIVTELIKESKRKIESLDHRYHEFEAIDSNNKFIGVFDAISKVIQTDRGIIPLNLQLGQQIVEGLIRFVKPTSADFIDIY